jgi:O-acetyl-ADP-ribose deacetylase (regulator of RNase III)
MIQFVTGDIIDSPADCLVNTVNCEGFMGKGIAYQFKLRFPENEAFYKKACQARSMIIGKVLPFCESGKLIINFPTKDKWRGKSTYDYIERGMSDLVEFLRNASIKSIAIPPLGCGNGGLEWITVKEIIVKALSAVEEKLTVFIFEPSQYYKIKPLQMPKLTASHLLLMRLKSRLTHFNKMRLQKSAFFMNVFSDEDYFVFDEYKYGPYSHSIDICSRMIKEYQEYYSISTVDAEKILYNSLVSTSVIAKINKYENAILKASSFANSIGNDYLLELVATVMFLVKKEPDCDSVELVTKFQNWSKRKAENYSAGDIAATLNNLEASEIISKSLLGYSINKGIAGGTRMPKYKPF